MKHTLRTNRFISICLSFAMIFLFFSCQKDSPGRPEGFPFDPRETHYNDWVDGAPPQNLNVVLVDDNDKKSNIGNASIGFVKFRQDNPDHIINLYTSVFNLKPHHTYQLQRAVNPITDPDCSSISWLTLGKGLVAQSIHTNALGYGQEDLFRNIAAVPSGAQFRIKFQIIDSATQLPVLESICLAYTVK